MSFADIPGAVDQERDLVFVFIFPELPSQDSVACTLTADLSILGLSQGFNGCPG